MELLLAQPRGFCAGVARAIDIVERALAMHGRPVYVYHEIVHNGYVVKDLATRGAIFVNDIDAIPIGAVTVFSAHGVANSVVEHAKQRSLQVIDATCPLVAKVHRQAQVYTKLAYEIVIIGHSGHEEVEGTMGSVDGPVHVVATVEDVAALPIDANAKIAYVTQTTLSPDDTREIIDALVMRFPHIIGPELDDICYATLNRQHAVRELAKQADLMLVVGARNSSNSNRLREVAQQHQVPAYLIEDATEIDPRWLQGVHKIGITAGASAPEILVTEVSERLFTLGATSVRQMPGPIETQSFRLPTQLRQIAV